MLKVRVIPTLLIREVNLVKGPSFDSWRAVGSPMQAVKVFNRRDVDELIILDINATPTGSEPDYEQIAILAQECFVPLTVGGGVGSLDCIRKLLHAGADKVAINTRAYVEPRFITEAATSFRFAVHRRCGRLQAPLRTAASSASVTAEGIDGPRSAGVVGRAGTTWRRRNSFDVDRARRRDARVRPGNDSRGYGRRDSFR